jgi:peptide/nickel transport system permease protein
VRETSSIQAPLEPPAAVAIAATADEAAPRVATATRILRSLRRDMLALASLVVLAVIVLAALLPDAFATHSPTALSMDRLEAPSSAHPFGTDQFGRDIFSRCIAGARVSIVVGLITVLLAVSIGVPLGAIAGYTSPRAADNVIMRVMDVMMAFPPIILAITVIAALGTEPLQIGPITLPHIAKLMFVIGILYAPQVARIVRSAVLVEREEQYVAAEKALGTSEARILFGDVLRNGISPVIVHATLLVANAILAEAALSFLGLGIQPPQPSWGGMLADARTYVASGEWWMTVFPGLLIFFVVCALNVLGDFLRDLLDPRELTVAG